MESQKATETAAFVKTRIPYWTLNKKLNCCPLEYFLRSESYQCPHCGQYSKYAIINEVLDVTTFFEYHLKGILVGYELCILHYRFETAGGYFNSEGHRVAQKELFENAESIINKSI